MNREQVNKDRKYQSDLTSIFNIFALTIPFICSSVLYFANNSSKLPNPIVNPSLNPI